MGCGSLQKINASVNAINKIGNDLKYKDSENSLLLEEISENLCDALMDVTEVNECYK